MWSFCALFVLPTDLPHDKEMLVLHLDKVWKLAPQFTAQSMKDLPLCLIGFIR